MSLIHPTRLAFCRRTPLASLLSMFVLLGISANWASAQTAPTPAANEPPAQPGQAQPGQGGSAEEVLKLNEVIVTAGVVPQTKLESPVAVTTLDSYEIQALGPLSMGELMKAIPGIYVESSGGEAGNNFLPRGIFGIGGMRYMTLEEDGLPVISESDMYFSDEENFVRPALWFSTIEGVRGGTSGIFVSNAAVATVNFIGREGGDRFQGENKLTIGNFGFLRNDLWFSGPLAQSTTFAIGGYYRLDNGIRSPGFVADRGGELFANIKHLFDNGKGYIKVSGKLMDDRTQFLLPIPLSGSTTDPKQIPGGPDINTGATVSNDIRYFSFPNSPMGPIHEDMGNGIYENIGYIGSDLVYKLTDQLTFADKNRYTHVDKSNNINPFNAPTPFQAIANTLATTNTTPGEYAGALNTATGNYNFKLLYPGQGGAVAASNAAAAGRLNGNGLGDLDGYWFAGATLSNFQNDARLIGSFADGKTTITGGLYYSWFTENRVWQWNQMLIDVCNSYHRLDLVYVDGNGSPVGPQYTYNGFTQVGGTYLNGDGDIRDASPYFVIDQRIGDKLTLDGGIRFQNEFYSGSGEGTASYNLNTYLSQGANYPALMNAQFGNGKMTDATASEHRTAYTLGANYEFTKSAALSLRYSDSPRFPADDTIIGGSNAFPPIEDVRQYEASLKFASHNLAFFITPYLLEQRGVLQNGVQFVNGQPVMVNILFGSDSPGLEIEGVWTPIGGLSFDLHGTFQRARIVTSALTQVPTGGYVSLDGKRGPHSPEEFGEATISYTFPSTRWGTFGIRGGCTYTGSYFQDDADTVPISGFALFSAGVDFTTQTQVVFRVQAENLTNSTAVTEGDPRAGFVSQGGTGVYFNARPALPRTIQFSVSLRF